MDETAATGAIAAEEAKAVLERLARIDALKPGQAARVQVLGELQELVREAEAWARLEGDERARSAVERIGTHLTMNLESPNHAGRHERASSIVSTGDHRHSPSLSRTRPSSPVDEEPC